ncbi:HAMP domain-containing histidine kinase [Micromonospora sp. DR5-3]|uniref:sensor histidine kinase n=1 Tax=unclassified Micromonospora TaxID=2617518 RepID=UPI0011D7A574|nr:MULTISPECIES: HAMP domain-containing sensor histidine kinase [unclassified Micromonospora]MCW3815002.1 HAMP domain-containing histidine kinase [Micromonospora sp. DR5-3]TYC25326.1 HAMP domain-containing histidine kinase [Micromonospora sp. MP36]
MRRRLVISYLLLMVLVLLALETPLAATLATRETDRVRADRLADASRFASLGGPALRGGGAGPLDGELAAYDDLYGIGAALVDRDGRTVTASVSWESGPGTAAALDTALAGQQFSAPDSVWPWVDGPVVVAVPVTDGGEVLGAVVTVTPPGNVRRTVASWWLLLAAIGLLAVLACVSTAFGLAGWVLRPVTELDAVTHEIAEGDGTARVRPRLGPPELRRLAASFNNMADVVSDVMDRQRAFVAHASHQLRNPLAALRLRVEELGPSLTDDDGRAEHRLALEETDRLATLLDALLTLARAERTENQRVSVDAAEVAASRVAAWLPLARHRSIDLRLDTVAAPAYARTVPTAIDQALDALIDNAVKFSDPGGEVTVAVRPADGGIALQVRDTGPGMTASQLGQATERFWRAPDVQNVDGAGLGLTIVAVLVDASDGRLTMRQGQPRGLVAELWFPSPDDPAAERGSGAGATGTDPAERVRSAAG